MFRLGDPECQVVIGRIKNSFLDICIALQKKSLKNLKINLSNEVSSCIVLASKGYPKNIKRNKN